MHSSRLLGLVSLLLFGLLVSSSVFAEEEKGPIDKGIDAAVKNATNTSPAGIGDKIVGIFVPGVGPIGAGLSTTCKEASKEAAELCLDAADECWTGSGAWPALTPLMLVGAGISRIGQGAGAICECVCEPVTSVVSLSTTIVNSIKGPPTGGPGGPVTPGGGRGPSGPITPGGSAPGPITPGGPSGGGSTLCANMPSLTVEEMEEIAKGYGIESTTMANNLRCQNALCPASQNPDVCAVAGKCLGSVGGASGTLMFNCFCQFPPCTGSGPSGPVVTPGGSAGHGPITPGGGGGPNTPGGGPGSPVACASKTVTAAGTYLAGTNKSAAELVAAGLTNPDGSLNVDAIYDAQCQTNTFCPTDGDSCAWAQHQFCHCEGGLCGPGTGTTTGPSPDGGTSGGTCATDDGNPSPGTDGPDPGCEYPIFDNGFFYCVDDTPDDPSTPGGPGCQYPVEGDYWINFWIDGDIIQKKNWVCADLLVGGKTPSDEIGDVPQATACVDKPNTPLSQVSVDMQYGGILYKEEPWNEQTYYKIYVCGYGCDVVSSVSINGEASLACADIAITNPDDTVLPDDTTTNPDDTTQPTPSTCDYPDFTFNNECYDVVPQSTLSLPNCATVVYAPNGGGVYCAEGHATNFVSLVTYYTVDGEIVPYYYSEDHTVQFIEATGNVVGLPYCNDLAVETFEGNNVCIDAKALDRCLVTSPDGIGCLRVGIAITSDSKCDAAGGYNTLNAYGEHGCLLDDPSTLQNTLEANGGAFGWFCDSDNVCIWIEPQDDPSDGTITTPSGDGTTTGSPSNEASNGGSIFDQIGESISNAGENFSTWLNETFG